MFNRKRQQNQVPEMVIHIADRVAPIVSSRDIAASLENDIKESHADKIQLDFSDVDFVSRSAAHQFLQMKESFQNINPQRELSFQNTNSEVKEMFRIIAANRAVPENHKPSFTPTRISVEALTKMGLE